MKNKDSNIKSKTKAPRVSQAALLLLLLVPLLNSRSHVTGPQDNLLEQQAFLAWIQSVPPVVAWMGGIVAGLGVLSQLVLAVMHLKTPKMHRHLWAAGGFLILGSAVVLAALMWLPGFMAR